MAHGSRCAPNRSSCRAPAARSGPAARPAAGTTGSAPSTTCGLSDRHVAYAKPGLIGVFDAVRGSYRELEATSAAATAAALLASRPGGLRAWGRGRPAATVLNADPASEVALGDGVAYWLDGAGTPQVAEL